MTPYALPYHIAGRIEIHEAGHSEVSGLLANPTP